MTNVVQGTQKNLPRSDLNVVKMLAGWNATQTMDLGHAALKMGMTHPVTRRYKLITDYFAACVAQATNTADVEMGDVIVNATNVLAHEMINAVGRILTTPYANRANVALAKGKSPATCRMKEPR